AEGSQVGAGERISAPADGSVVHVEVFRAECVGTLILGRPRPLSGHRRAGPPRDVRYTLIWEEPVFRDRCNFESRSIYAVLVALDGMLSSSRMEHGWLSQTIEPILAGNRLLADGLTSPRKHGSVDLHLSGTNDIP
ncbi:hypothetical protein, partial [Propionibacterium freudenreichii]|uniref:hypothetical protein n=1 Tax=Propionibacterium freudenreichii TaxID=1744 RepID=UPI0035D0B658